MVVVAAIGVVSVPHARAASAQELTRNASQALRDLYAKEKSARVLGEKATAVLVFPGIVKAGFMFGGQIGEGVLFQNGRVAGYYNSIAASYGFQAGIQKFGYALFFMNRDALSYLARSEGFEIGAGPSIVVVDKGMGISSTSTTLTHDVYAYIFNQKGLMGGVGLQGSKITRIDK
jgi:lipid-binding SYLF domain-containing protein